VRWKDILERVPKVLCDEERDMREWRLVGEGVQRGPEEWVLDLERVLGVFCELARSKILESGCWRNSFELVWRERGGTKDSFGGLHHAVDDWNEFFCRGFIY
jgi:hypothetical protein